MEQRRLGNTGLVTAPLVIGGNVFGWTADKATSFSVLDAGLEAGINVIDTADVYTRLGPPFEGGESETIIGQWLKSRGVRERVVISSKFGLDMGTGMQGLSARYMVQAIEASLRRLQTDYIDLYQAHFDDDVTATEDTLAGFDQLIRSGKVRAIGASNYSIPRLREALDAGRRLGVATYQTYQVRYNVYDRHFYEGEVEALCREYGLGVMTYFSLANGFLTGKFRSVDEVQQSRRSMWLKEYFNPRGMRILDTLEQVSARYASTPAQVALAWIMARPGVTAAIASATNLDQLYALIGATRLRLDSEAIEILNAASTGDSGVTA